MKDMVYDASIQKWRTKTAADRKWAKQVVEAVLALEGKKEETE